MRIRAVGGKPARDRREHFIRERDKRDVSEGDDGLLEGEMRRMIGFSGGKHRFHIAPVTVHQPLDVVQFVGIGVPCQLRADFVERRQFAVRQVNSVLLYGEVHGMIAVDIPVRTQSILRRNAAEFFDVMDIADGLTVGETRADIALCAVPVRGHGSGDGFETVAHDARPVAGNFVVASGGSAVAAVVDHVKNAGSVHAFDGNHGHNGVIAAPRILSETDAAVPVVLTAVDADVAQAGSDADFGGAHFFDGFHGCRKHRGEHDLVNIRTVNVAPALESGDVRRGMGVGRGNDDVFPRNAAELADFFADFVAEFRLEIADGDGQEKGGLPGVRERGRRHIQRIVDGRADLMRIVAVQQGSDFGGNIPSGRTCEKDFCHDMPPFPVIRL